MLWFVFSKTDLMLHRIGEGQYDILDAEECPIEVKEWTEIHTITPMDDGREVRTLVLDAPLPAEVCDNLSLEAHPLRESYHLLPYELYLKAGKCQEINYWSQNTRFCGVCGGPMKLHTDISKRCTHCGKEVWPLLATAIIVLIECDDKVLLVRAKNFKREYYGLVAGFVETGETLEEAVHREVMEETGLTITDVTYFGSQPWPYPCGLMVGFKARYVSGDIHLQVEELAKGGWFCRDKMPPIPEKLSIARRLIDSWLGDDNA